MMRNRFEAIYNRLCDEESKEIFEKRLMYSLTGNETYLFSLGKKYEQQVLQSKEWKSFYEGLVSIGGGIALYSGGYWGKELLLHTGELPWKYVVDKNPREKELCGVPIITLEHFLELNQEADTIVIASRVYYEEIREELLRKGISENRIVDGAVLFDLSEGKQYFDLAQLPHDDEKEVFVDVGCYDGLSVAFFNAWCNGNGFSYCFEPDKTNIERIHRVLKNKNLSSYELIDKGVWSREGKIGFVSTGNSVSHISEAKDASSIDVVSLDAVLGDKRVTFLKMDIEGAELEAIKGAKRIIEEQKPKLAICVYHKPEDIWELPELILSYNKEYKFYIRHYSYKDNETVLYAV
jgi:FkbM family methyltransferase